MGKPSPPNQPKLETVPSEVVEVNLTETSYTEFKLVSTKDATKLPLEEQVALNTVLAVKPW